MRVGHGYDVHRLKRNRKLILCGVEIPYKKGLLGHSDADVATHALTDALLGASSLGDIGALFPNNSLKYLNADSIEMLKEVVDRVKKSGFSILNIDLTVVAQAPVLKDYIEPMKEVLSKSVGIPKNAVSVKATTEEGLGFTGHKRGIAAHCVVLLDSAA